LPFCRIDRFKKGEIVFRPDSPRVGLIVDGAVALDWFESRETLSLTHRGVGRIIGAENIILGHCALTATATSPITLAWLTPEKLKGVLDRLPHDQREEVWTELQEAAAELQEELLQRISLRERNARERVVRTLQRLAGEEGRSLKISCSRLGKLCGTSRETVNHILLALRREDRIERRGQMLVLREI
jgi:CRP-like cAMP-binding protein